MINILKKIRSQSKLWRPCHCPKRLSSRVWMKYLLYIAAKQQLFPCKNYTRPPKLEPNIFGWTNGTRLWLFHLADAPSPAHAPQYYHVPLTFWCLDITIVRYMMCMEKKSVLPPVKNDWCLILCASAWSKLYLIRNYFLCVEFEYLNMICRYICYKM